MEGEHLFKSLGAIEFSKLCINESKDLLFFLRSLSVTSTFIYEPNGRDHLFTFYHDLIPDTPLPNRCRGSVLDRLSIFELRALIHRRVLYHYVISLKLKILFHTMYDASHIISLIMVSLPCHPTEGAASFEL